MLSLILPKSWRLWLFGTWPAKQAPGDKDYVEIELERRGNLKELQLYRYELIKKVDEYNSAILLELETFLRETSQREITLNEKLVKATTDKEDHDDANYRAITEELADLNQKYWLLERQWWLKRSDFPDGPLTRGLTLWRSHPRWYMHRVLVNDCAGKGGCCGRGSRKLGVGHCTVECGCCIQSRGFAVTPEHKEKLSSWFETYEAYEDPYYKKIIMASIWGLWQGSPDSPFDLIDESATVDLAAINCKGLAFAGTPNGGYVLDEDDDSKSTDTLL
ncbi:unnamed protein product [Penicillium bialowiezense]